MSSDDFLHETGQVVWRLAWQLVAGVGQMLLWILNGIGRLLRPIAHRLTAALYGKGGRTPGPAGPGRTSVLGPGETPDAPLPRWINAWRDFAKSGAYAPVTGGLLALAALIELPLHHVQVASLAGGFALAATIPLMFRRESLRPVAAVSLSAFAAGLLSGQPLLVVTSFGALYTLYLLAQQLPRQSTGVLAVSSVASVIVIYLASGALDGIPWLAGLVAVLAAIGLGDARRVVESAEASMGEAQDRTSATLSQLNAVQREQAVLRERARIARELHDVVAHSVSMIAVQAETAPYTMRELSPEAQNGFKEIAGSAREALEEMRRLLNVLRADANAEPEVAPQPRLDGIAELIEQYRGAGGEARLTVHGAARPLSTTIELSAYRIVQEALTNARRHAPGAQVRIELDYLPDRLAVKVVDSGSAATEMIDATRVEGGYGLVGMKERATLLGGRFAAGRQAGGGFAVEAELPVTGPARTR